MTLRELINQEMNDSKVMIPIELTKTSQENIKYLIEKFECETTDELINILLCYAATTEYTDRIIKDLEVN